VFIGGGTPGFFPTQIDQLCALIHANGLQDDCEWTVEVAPNEINPQKLEAFLRGGVNRLIFGCANLGSEFYEGTWEGITMFERCVPMRM
jgi:coproporphyrinogen III oxidase-like Fe-S oxidoreductase